jgi:hypothetical protein
MKSFFTISFLLFCSSLLQGQTTVFQVWNELGTSGKINKEWSYGVDLTTRIGNVGVVTIFPQVSLKYKLNKYIRPSIDYRMISNRELNGNYLPSHRLNGNLQFSYLEKRHAFGFRIRYQYSFNRLIGTYEPEFDKAFRFKPSYSYDLNNSIFTPKVSCEFFYNPTRGIQGQQFTRIRYYAGVALELEGPHHLEIGYYYDQKINASNPVNRSILNLSYSYTLEGKKKEGAKKPRLGVRYL